MSLGSQGILPGIHRISALTALKPGIAVHASSVGISNIFLPFGSFISRVKAKATTVPGTSRWRSATEHTVCKYNIKAFLSLISLSG